MTIKTTNNIIKIDNVVIEVSADLTLARAYNTIREQVAEIMEVLDGNYNLYMEEDECYEVEQVLFNQILKGLKDKL